MGEEGRKRRKRGREEEANERKWGEIRKYGGNRRKEKGRGRRGKKKDKWKKEGEEQTKKSNPYLHLKA